MPETINRQPQDFEKNVEKQILSEKITSALENLGFSINDIQEEGRVVKKNAVGKFGNKEVKIIFFVWGKDKNIDAKFFINDKSEAFNNDFNKGEFIGNLSNVILAAEYNVPIERLPTWKDEYQRRKKEIQDVLETIGQK